MPSLPRLRAEPSLGLLAALLLGGCTGSRATPPGDTLATDISAAAAFLDALRVHCGQAFEGRIAIDEPPPAAADPFAGQTLVMHVRECDPEAIRIPFHVGADRSRTWVLTRNDGGLRLKHDHRHQDGSPDAVTMYGGDSSAPGSAQRLEFPVDAESIATFRAAGLVASVSNVWALELGPGPRFVYELTRPGRRFRVEFDLAHPVAPPQPPWGSD
jgi:hypothetical protein